jgi:hypothetical protein
MLLPMVRAQMRAKRPSEEVKAAAARLLDPGPMPKKTRDMRSTHAPWLWHREMTWCAAPEARYREATRRGHYKPAGLIAMLVAVTVFTDEREGVGFPGDAEDTAKARALLDLFKRPKSGQRGGKIPATVLRVLVKRLRAATTLGVYLLTTARAVSAANLAAQRERGRQVARRDLPAPRIIEPVAKPRAAGGWPYSEEVIARYADRIEK